MKICTWSMIKYKASIGATTTIQRTRVSAPYFPWRYVYKIQTWKKGRPSQKVRPFGHLCKTLLPSAQVHSPYHNSFISYRMPTIWRSILILHPISTDYRHLRDHCYFWSDFFSLTVFELTFCQDPLFKSASLLISNISTGYDCSTTSGNRLLRETRWRIST